MDFIETLKERNAVLFWFGLINFCTALVLLYLSTVKPIEFVGVNAWFKPMKFALSTAILTWSLAWYMGALPNGKGLDIAVWLIVVTLAFEVLYITWQAARGEASHFNVSTPFYSLMYTLMGVAAVIASLATGYIGLKFFSDLGTELPMYYVWAIRLGFLLFVIFSFEGFLMGGRMAHSVGGPDGSPGIPFFNWSLTYGDLRIAHFVGMHALQLLPLLSWYLLKDLKLTFAGFGLYSLLAVFVLVQALRGNSMFN